MNSQEILQQIRQQLARRVPWQVYARVIELLHEKLKEIHGINWTTEMTAGYVNRQAYDTKKYLELASYIKEIPEFAHVSNKRQALSLMNQYHNNKEIFRLKILQAIQNKRRKSNGTIRDSQENNAYRTVDQSNEIRSES